MTSPISAAFLAAVKKHPLFGNTMATLSVGSNTLLRAAMLLAGLPSFDDATRFRLYLRDNPEAKKRLVEAIGTVVSMTISSLVEFSELAERHRLTVMLSERMLELDVELSAAQRSGVLKETPHDDVDDAASRTGAGATGSALAFHPADAACRLADRSPRLRRHNVGIAADPRRGPRDGLRPLGDKARRSGTLRVRCGQHRHGPCRGGPGEGDMTGDPNEDPPADRPQWSVGDVLLVLAAALAGIGVVHALWP